MNDLRALSLQHCPRGTIPDSPTNEERARAFRDSLPIVLANGYQWDHIKRVEYARTQTEDGRGYDPETRPF